jgi:hypothetical protein
MLSTKSFLPRASGVSCIGSKSAISKFLDFFLAFRNLHIKVVVRMVRKFYCQVRVRISIFYRGSSLGVTMDDDTLDCHQEV